MRFGISTISDMQQILLNVTRLFTKSATCPHCSMEPLANRNRASPFCYSWKTQLVGTSFSLSDPDFHSASLTSRHAEQKFCSKMSPGTSKDLFMGNRRRSRGLTHLEMTKWRPPVTRVSAFHCFIPSECPIPSMTNEGPSQSDSAASEILWAKMKALSLDVFVGLCLASVCFITCWFHFLLPSGMTVDLSSSPKPAQSGNLCQLVMDHRGHSPGSRR